jgi:hypothetical protein
MTLADYIPPDTFKNTVMDDTHIKLLCAQANRAIADTLWMKKKQDEQEAASKETRSLAEGAQLMLKNCLEQQQTEAAELKATREALAKEAAKVEALEKGKTTDQVTITRLEMQLVELNTQFQLYKKPRSLKRKHDAFDINSMLERLKASKYEKGGGFTAMEFEGLLDHFGVDRMAALAYQKKNRNPETRFLTLQSLQPMGVGCSASPAVQPVHPI